MKMLPNIRREKILEMIRTAGFVKVQDVSRIFEVTEVTVRKDLERLENDGYIVKEHGGAFLKDTEMGVRNLKSQNLENTGLKRTIARKAIEFIQDGETIIIDSGSCTYELAQLICNMKNLTVITNSMNIALVLGAQTGINIIITGGELNDNDYSLTGQKVVEFLQDLHVDKLFLSVTGIDLISGLSCSSIDDSIVKKSMIESADKTYLLAESEIIGKNSFANLGKLSLIDCLVTDFVIKPEISESIMNQNISLVLSKKN